MPIFRSALISLLVSSLINENYGSTTNTDMSDRGLSNHSRLHDKHTHRTTFDTASCLFQGILLLSLDVNSMSEYGVVIPPNDKHIFNPQHHQQSTASGNEVEDSEKTIPVSFPILDVGLSIDLLNAWVEMIPTQSMGSLVSLLQSLALSVTAWHRYNRLYSAYKIIDSNADQSSSCSMICSAQFPTPPTLLLDTSISRVRFGLLKACNAITKRISSTTISHKTSNPIDDEEEDTSKSIPSSPTDIKYISSATVLMLLTSLFPVDERSGLNVSGSSNAFSCPGINVENSSSSSPVPISTLISSSHEMEMLDELFETQRELIEASSSNATTANTKRKYLTVANYVNFWSILETLSCPSSLQPVKAPTLASQSSESVSVSDPLFTFLNRVSTLFDMFEEWKVSSMVTSSSIISTSQSSATTSICQAQIIPTIRSPTSMVFSPTSISSASASSSSSSSSSSGTLNLNLNMTSPNNPKDTTQALSNEDNSTIFLGKHLTSPSLLRLQLDDPGLRLVVVTQILFFLSAIVLPGSFHKNVVLLEISKRIHAANYVSWVQSLSARALNIQATIDPCFAYDIGNFLRETETLWRNWKSSDCPKTTIPVQHISNELIVALSSILPKTNSDVRNGTQNQNEDQNEDQDQLMILRNNQNEYLRCFFQSISPSTMNSMDCRWNFAPLSKDYMESIDYFNLDYGTMANYKYTDSILCGAPNLARIELGMKTMNWKNSAKSRGRRIDPHTLLDETAGNISFEETEEWDELLANDGVVAWRSLRAISTADAEFAIQSAGNMEKFAVLAGGDCYVRLRDKKLLDEANARKEAENRKLQEQLKKRQEDQAREEERQQKQAISAKQKKDTEMKLQKQLLKQKRELAMKTSPEDTSSLTTKDSSTNSELSTDDAMMRDEPGLDSVVLSQGIDSVVDSVIKPPSVLKTMKSRKSTSSHEAAIDGTGTGTTQTDGESTTMSDSLPTTHQVPTVQPKREKKDKHEKREKREKQGKNENVDQNIDPKADSIDSTLDLKIKDRNISQAPNDIRPPLHQKPSQIPSSTYEPCDGRDPKDLRHRNERESREFRVEREPRGSRQSSSQPQSQSQDQRDHRMRDREHDRRDIVHLETRVRDTSHDNRDIIREVRSILAPDNARDLPRQAPIRELRSGSVEIRHPRDIRDVRDGRDGRDVRETRDIRVSRESHDTREMRTHRDTRDGRDGRDSSRDDPRDIRDGHDSSRARDDPRDDPRVNHISSSHTTTQHHYRSQSPPMQAGHSDHGRHPHGERGERGDRHSQADHRSLSRILHPEQRQDTLHHQNIPPQRHRDHSQNHRHDDVSVTNEPTHPPKRYRRN